MVKTLQKVNMGNVTEIRDSNRKIKKNKKIVKNSHEENKKVVKSSDKNLNKSNIKKSEDKKELKRDYDLIIVGAGPGGMGCAVYAARYKLKVLVIGYEMGGLMTQAHEIQNYLGFNSISGKDLSQKFVEQLEYQKIPVIKDCVAKITKGFKVETTKNGNFNAKNVVIAAGLKRRSLGVKGEEEFKGRGVTYCATCDAPMFRGLDVAVVGGGDGAASAAILVAKYAKQVYMLYRKNKLRAEPYWVEQIEKSGNIKVLFDVNVDEILGEKLVKSIKMDNGKSINVSGVIIEIGSVPTDILIKDLNIETNDKGYIVVNKAMETNVRRVYAVGDINNGSNNFRQIATAFGEGAIAANSVFMNLNKK